MNLIAIAPLIVASDLQPPSTKISFWDAPKRGANYILSATDPAKDFADAKAYGMDVLRLFIPGVPRDWAEDQDYFSSARFQADLASFDKTLDRTASAGLTVIIVGGSVPGRQWLWNEHGRGDQRLWRNARWHEELAAYWSQLARRYQHHPAVAAYEILNEPNPEVIEDREHWNPAELEAFQRRVAGTAADLNKLYQSVVERIRSVDAQTPVILDAGLWAAPMALVSLEPIKNDPCMLYSFHWYAPATYTTWRLNQGRLTYPGCVTEQPGPSGAVERIEWNAEQQGQMMADPIWNWQQRHGIPANRILCGEFSADRRAAGANQWNLDVLAILERNGWHWTYYAFREHEWDAKDFELGPDPNQRERTTHPMMRIFFNPDGR